MFFTSVYSLIVLVLLVACSILRGSNFASLLPRQRDELQPLTYILSAFHSAHCQRVLNEDGRVNYAVVLAT